MKKNTHPPYQEILFVDTATGKRYVCKSTLTPPKDREVYEGKEYPVRRLDISSFSHPFYTKSKKLVDTEGMVEKFRNRFEKNKTRSVELSEISQEEPKEREEKKTVTEKRVAKPTKSGKPKKTK